MTKFRLPTYTLDLPSFMDVKKKEVMIDLKVAKLGTIDSYDESKGTATVVIKTKFNEKTPYEYDYPKLSNVPVLKTKYFSHPIKQGDGCLIIFLDTNFTAWLDGGKVLAPATPRLHDLNDAIAIVGIDTISERPTFGKDNTNTIIDAGEGQVVIKNEGSYKGDLANIINKLIDCLTNLNNTLITNAYTSGSTPLNVGTFSTDITSIKTEAKKLLKGII